MNAAKSMEAGAEEVGLPVSHLALVLEHMTLAEFAQRVLGKSQARAGRDWCQRHGIPYRRDGKHNWVSIADVRRVLAGLPLHGGPAHERADAATAAVAVLTKKR